jgi:hypothetical protein
MWLPDFLRCESGTAEMGPAVLRAQISLSTGQFSLGAPKASNAANRVLVQPNRPARLLRDHAVIAAHPVRKNVVDAGGFDVAVSASGKLHRTALP